MGNGWGYPGMGMGGLGCQRGAKTAQSSHCNAFSPPDCLVFTGMPPSEPTNLDPQ